MHYSVQCSVQYRVHCMCSTLQYSVHYRVQCSVQYCAVKSAILGRPVLLNGKTHHHKNILLQCACAYHGTKMPNHPLQLQSIGGLCNLHDELRSARNIMSPSNISISRHFILHLKENSHLRNVSS